MKRSKMSLSCKKLTTIGGGTLVPLNLTEVLPGDSIQQATNALIRVNPLLAPIMHKVDVRIHHWFVPHRLVWEDWEDFITGGSYGSTPPVFPTITLTGGAPVSSIADHFGITTDKGNPVVSALPFRAYNLIWNNFYRDQDLQTEKTIDLTSGPDTTTTLGPYQVSWQKDYFTTARPWAQKGSDITIPMSDEALVLRKTNADAVIGRIAGSNTAVADGDVVTLSGNLRSAGSGSNMSIDPNGTLYTDLEANAGSINDLRMAFALQRYEEARARYGSRYTEYLRYLGINPADARLQLPEYLGGGKQTIQFSEVLQTAPTTDTGTSEDFGVGNLYGHGIGSMRSNRYRKFFQEHGYVMTLISIRPEAIYTDGIPRTFLRRTKEDFFQKELQHIGQQEIKKAEIYYADATADEMWGFQDRYDEYRQGFSSISGIFRNTMNTWHMARMFSSPPTLNADFVECDPTDRVFAVPDADDNFWIYANHSIQARRIVSNKTGSFVF